MTVSWMPSLRGSVLGASPWFSMGRTATDSIALCPSAVVGAPEGLGFLFREYTVAAIAPISKGAAMEPTSRVENGGGDGERCKLGSFAVARGPIARSRA